MVTVSALEAMWAVYPWADVLPSLDVKREDFRSTEVDLEYTKVYSSP